MYYLDLSFPNCQNSVNSLFGNFDLLETHVKKVTLQHQSFFLEVSFEVRGGS